MIERLSVQTNTDFEVEPEDLYRGIEILQFLMEACPPGTVPDASILGSITVMVSFNTHYSHLTFFVVSCFSERKV